MGQTNHSRIDRLKVLQPFRATLKILILEITCWKTQEDRSLPLDLRDFGQLRMLRVPAEFLLPSHLRTQLNPFEIAQPQPQPHTGRYKLFTTICNVLPRSLLSLALYGEQVPEIDICSYVDCADVNSAGFWHKVAEDMDACKTVLPELQQIDVERRRRPFFLQIREGSHPYSEEDNKMEADDMGGQTETAGAQTTRMRRATP